MDQMKMTLYAAIGLVPQATGNVQVIKDVLKRNSSWTDEMIAVKERMRI